MQRKLLIGSFALLAAFALFSARVWMGGWGRFDFFATVQLQRFIPISLDSFLSTFSLLGSFEVMTAVLGFVLIYRRQLHGMMVFFLYGLGMCIEVAGKLLIYHPGPPHIFFRYDLGFLFPSSYVSTHYSFPSGHSMRAAFLVMFILGVLWQSKHFSRGIQRLFSGLLAAALAIMLISRVSLGEHWASDVIAGALLGAGLGVLAVAISLRSLVKRRLANH